MHGPGSLGKLQAGSKPAGPEGVVGPFPITGTALAIWFTATKFDGFDVEVLNSDAFDFKTGKTGKAGEISGACTGRAGCSAELFDRTEACGI